MHEIGIAQCILDAVQTEARRRPDAAFRAVGVRIGELSSIDPDALDFAFTVLTRDTTWNNVKLEIEWCPRQKHCVDCGAVFAVTSENSRCSRCGGGNARFAGGTELDIVYLELEEPCAKR